MFDYASILVQNSDVTWQTAHRANNGSPVTIVTGEFVYLIFSAVDRIFV